MLKRLDLFLLVASSLITVFDLLLLPVYFLQPTENLAVSTAVVLFLTFAFLLFSRKKASYLIFAAFILASIFAWIGSGEAILAAKIVSGFEQFFVSFFFYIPIIFFIFFGAYLYRHKPIKHSRELSIAFFLSAAILLLYYNLVLIVSWHIDDEIYIQMLSAKEILQFQNPYLENYTPMLLSNATNYGVTITTKNSIMGVLDYPALFPIVEIPFIALPFNMQLILKLQVFLFMYLLFITIGGLAKKEALAKPSYLLLSGILIALFFLSSSIQALMLALVLLAYSKSGTRYGWLFLGLAASIQEMLWISVLLLISYTFYNFGLKKGFKELLLTAAVFFIINGAFIAAGPINFIRNVIMPATSYIIPNSYGLIGYLLELYYSIPVNSYGFVSAIFILFSLFFFLYLNEKRLVFLIGTIPFLFLSHGLSTYYSFFIGAFLISLALEYKKGEKRRNKRRNYFAYFAIASFSIAVLFILLEHIEYASSFYMNTLSENASIVGNHLSYNIAISYNAPIRSFSTLLVVYNGTIFVYGVNGGILTENEAKTNSSSINTNLIYLNGSGIKKVSYYIQFNASKKTAYYIEPIIYNGSYAYYPPPLKLSVKDNI